MKYKIDIIDKYSCTMLSTRELKEDCVIVSINDIDCNTVIYDNEKIIDVKKVWFDDIEFPIEGYVTINTDIARDIKEFIDFYKNKVSHIIIHCTAGISRSGAVGCCIARYLNNDDEYILGTGRYIPNKLVYKTMCEIFELDFSDKLFKRKLNVRNKGNHSNLKGYGDYGISEDDMFCDVIIEGGNSYD